MKKRSISIALSFILVFSAAAQDAQPTSQYMKAISQEQAIAVAQQYALEQGIRPVGWFGGEVDVMAQEGGWIVSFEQKPKDYIWITGDTFSIVIAPDGYVLKVYGGL